MSNNSNSLQYWTAYLGDPSMSTARAEEIIAAASALIKNSPVSAYVHWGVFDVSNDYNKLVLQSADQLDLDDSEGYYGIVYSEEEPFRTLQSGNHYAIDRTNSLAIFGEDRDEFVADGSEWALLARSIIDAIPELEVVDDSSS